MIKIINIKGVIYGIAMVYDIAVVIKPLDNNPENVQRALIYAIQNNLI